MPIKSAGELSALTRAILVSAGASERNADRMAEASRWLRKEREFSFYGEVDLIPTEEYGIDDARRALADARFVVDRTRAVFASVRGNDQSSG